MFPHVQTQIFSSSLQNCLKELISYESSKTFQTSSSLRCLTKTRFQAIWSSILTVGSFGLSISIFSKCVFFNGKPKLSFRFFSKQYRGMEVICTKGLHAGFESSENQIVSPFSALKSIRGLNMHLFLTLYRIPWAAGYGNFINQGETIHSFEHHIYYK